MKAARAGPIAPAARGAEAPTASGPAVDADPADKSEASGDQPAVASALPTTSLPLPSGGPPEAGLQVSAALATLIAAPSSSEGGVSETAPSETAARSVIDGVSTDQVRATPDGGREIVIKLDPEHLGSVSIKLKMTGGKVDVAITVADPRTLDMLDRDRHILTAAISAAGLGGNALSLAAAAPDAPSIPNAATGQPQSGTGSSADRDASASGDPAGGERRRASRNEERTARPGGSDEAAITVAPDRTGGVYV